MVDKRNKRKGAKKVATILDRKLKENEDEFQKIKKIAQEKLSKKLEEYKKSQSTK
jgi:hypothetical protein